jgi:hypothetical protein
MLAAELLYPQRRKEEYFEDYSGFRISSTQAGTVEEAVRTTSINGAARLIAQLYGRSLGLRGVRLPAVR